MNYRVYTTIGNDQYEIHMRGANIVHIIRNGYAVEYDELAMEIRETILIEALAALAKYLR